MSRRVATCRDERTSKATEKKENLDADTGKRSSTHETAVSRSTKADPESANEGHPDKICNQISDSARCLPHLRYQMQGRM